MKLFVFPFVVANLFWVECVELDVHLSLLDSECPGQCSPSIISCKASGGKIAGVCSDGKICCSRTVTVATGFGTSPIAVSCGASVMANKMVSFRSPNYPAFSGGTLTCDFTLQLNPATVGIRVDFIDLNLPSVPTNPVNFYESPNSVCDSDFILFRGFRGWSPDFRCGNLTGYSFMLERENEQPTLSTFLIMTSPMYRWNLKFTEIYFNEVESMDYAIRHSTGSGNGLNDKKQWMWYPPQDGSSLSYSPINVNVPGLPPSMLAPPSWQYVYPLRIRNGDGKDLEIGSEVEYLNSTGAVNSEATTLEFEEATTSENETQAVPNGFDNKNESHFSRIVGGMDAKPNSIPWQVSLQLIRKTETDLCGSLRNLSSHFCGGTIIGERTILSASHCFLSSSRHAHPLIPPHDIKVVVGEHDFCSENEVSSTREYGIERIMLHYNYISSDVLNDFAVIQLKKSIKFDKNVHPIALPDEHTKVYGLKPLLSGWGSLGTEANSTYPAILQQSSNIHILPEEECNYYQRQFLEYVIPDYRLSGKYKAAFNHGICTKPTDKVTEAGFGDSGGPLVIFGQSGAPVLIGVVSHMRPHEDMLTKQEFHLNYFGKVAAYRKWIVMTMLPQ